MNGRDLQQKDMNSNPHFTILVLAVRGGRGKSRNMICGTTLCSVWWTKQEWQTFSACVGWKNKENVCLHLRRYMKIGDSSLLMGWKMILFAARAVQMKCIKSVKLICIMWTVYMVNHHTAAEMTGWVKQAMETNSLLVILFHGVGSGNGLDVSVQDHRELLQFLKKNNKDIMITTMLDAATYIKQAQAGKWKQTNEKKILYNTGLAGLSLLLCLPAAMLKQGNQIRKTCRIKKVKKEDLGLHLWD